LNGVNDFRVRLDVLVLHCCGLGSCGSQKAELAKLKNSHGQRMFMRICENGDVTNKIWLLGERVRVAPACTPWRSIRLHFKATNRRDEATEGIGEASRCDKTAQLRDKMAQISVGLLEIKGNQGKSSPRAGSFSENPAARTTRQHKSCLSSHNLIFHFAEGASSQSELYFAILLSHFGKAPFSATRSLTAPAPLLQSHPRSAEFFA
jgi:hypothetical protein